MSKDIKKLSFIIPCYCSEKTILSVYEEICEVAKANNYSSYEIILVNDCSRDNTYEVIKNIALNDNRVISINFSKNFGQHSALMAGFNYASGDYIICLDDDGQTPACEVTKLLKKLDEGYDVVYAHYNIKCHSFFRNVGSFINKKMTEVLLGKPKSLSISSYFAVKKFIADEIKKYKYCYPYVLGLVLRSSSNITNVSVNHRKREIGTSGYNLKKLISLWLNGFTSFSVKPLRFASYFGMLTAIFGFIYTFYILFKYIIVGSAPLGWSSLMAAFLIISGVILMVLGLIGEYVGRIYLSITSNPQYVIKEVISKK